MKTPKQQVTWKRTEKAKGLAAIGLNNSLRAWLLCINGEEVGSLFHTQASALSLRSDKEPMWKIMFYRHGQGANLVLKQNFPTTRENEVAQAEDAKKFMLEIYPAVKAKYLTPEEPKPQSSAPPTPTAPE